MVQEYLKDKIVFVTGSSRGIGKAVAVRAAELGADVIVHCRGNRAQAQDTVDIIEKLGRRAASVQADLSREEEILQAVDQAWNAFGRIDVLVNNAGINFKKEFLETSTDELDRVYEANIRGTYLVTREIARRMCLPEVLKTLNAPRILTVTSVNGVRSGIGFSLYGGTKAFLEIMMKDLAMELAPSGIRVNTFPVGAISTDMTRFVVEDKAIEAEVNRSIPLGRMGRVEEIADLICAFSGPAGDYCTGSSILADGGLSLTRSMGLLKTTD